jgi:hypothetical protein
MKCLLNGCSIAGYWLIQPAAVFGQLTSDIGPTLLRNQLRKLMDRVVLSQPFRRKDCNVTRPTVEIPVNTWWHIFNHCVYRLCDLCQQRVIHISRQMVVLQNAAWKMSTVYFGLHLWAVSRSKMSKCVVSELVNSSSSLACSFICLFVRP